MSTPQIKSQRQIIRLWFEFYKLALGDESLSDNLKKSEELYSEWGDVRDVKFDDWWKTHKHLFGVTQVEETNEISDAPNALNVVIPLDQSVTKLTKKVKELITEKQKEILESQGLDPSVMKSFSPRLGKYNLTGDFEFRGIKYYETLVYYSLYREFQPKKIDTEFIDKMKERLQQRPKAKYIPFHLDVIEKYNNKKWDGFVYDFENQSRIRRRIKRGREICESVSLGEFPGKSKK